MTALTQPDKKFDSKAQLLADTFIQDLNQIGHFHAFQATKKYVAYDPGQAKGQSPLYPDTDIADFQVKAYAVLAPVAAPNSKVGAASGMGLPALYPNVQGT